MEILIRRYYERLPEAIQVLPETKIVFGWIAKCADMDTSVLIADLASNEDSAFASWQLSKNEYDDITDFRLKKFFISHFRKFNDHNNYPYVLNFYDEEKGISSLFLTGKNGSGKTSIFTGLEYILTPKHISTMLQRNIQYEESYFPYGNRSMEDIKLRLQLSNDRILEKPIKPELSLIPFFCSDFDLQDIQKETDLQQVFSQNIGLQAIENIIQRLNDTIKDLEHDNISEERTALNDEFSAMMPADIFYAGGIRNNRIFEKIRKALRLLSDNSTLRDIFADNIQVSITEKDTLKDKIEKMQKVWNMGQDLNNTALYQSCRPKMENYKTIVDLLEKDEYFDAEDLYRQTGPIEDFAWNFSKYALSLYNKFQDDKLNQDEGKRREVALRAITEWDRQQRKQEINRLLKGNTELLKSYPERVENLSRIIDAIKDLYVEDKQKLLDASKSLIARLLNIFTQLDKNNDKEEFLDIMEEQGRLIAIVRNEKVFGKNGFSTPAKYYNSFRYKLYCISIKVVLAFMTMKLNKIKAPLVFDDVFTASDFDNTVNICRFFEILFRVFKTFGLGEKDELQIILFTHDEIVMNSLSDIIDMISDDNENMKNFSYITGVLLDCRAIDERDCIKEQNGYTAYSLYSRIN